MAVRAKPRLARRALACLALALLLLAVACTAQQAPAPAATTAPQAAAPTAAPAAPKATEAPKAVAPTTAPAAAPKVTEAPKAAAPTTAPAAAAKAAAPKGTLTVAAAENPENLDPTMSLQIYNWTISFSMFDTLVRTGDDGKIAPLLAEKWEMVSPKAWKFTLRKGVKFHDGQPFTSKDVKATLDHIVDAKTQSRQAGIWSLYEKTETPDDQTAIIYTKEPMGTLLTNLTLTTIIPANPPKPYNDFPIGTGPFKFVEWKKDDRLVVEANPDYWGGAPKLERIVFRTIPELSTRVSALERGEVDLVDIIPAEEFARLQKAGIQLLKQPTTYLRFTWLAVDGPLSDVRVRQAINMAIDRKAIIKDLFGGEGFEIDGCVAPSVVGYAKMPALKYDVAEAKRLMQAAGQAQGFTMEIKTAEYLSKQKEMAEVIAGYLSEIGITANVVVQDQALWLKDLLALNWQSNQIGTSTLTGDADYTLRRLYHSSAKRVHYKNDKLDQLLMAQVGETDAAKRTELFRQACEILWNDVPTVFLFGVIQTYGVNSKVKNPKTYPSQFMFFKDVSME